MAGNHHQVAVGEEEPAVNGKRKKQTLLESDSEEDSTTDDSSSDDDNSSSSPKDKKTPKTTKTGVSFSINTEFAKDYQSRKQREELQRERGVDDEDDDDDKDDNSSSSSSEEEDEDADLLTPKLNVDILKTINALRSKDSKIYDPTIRFFPGSDNDDDEEEGEEDSEDDSGAPKREKKQKPKRVKDVLREQILEQMKEEEAEENGTSKNGSKNKSLLVVDDRTGRLAYDEQQQELRKAFLEKNIDQDVNADGDEDGHSSNNDEDFLVIKKRHTANDSDDDEAKQALDQELRNLEESVLQKAKSGDKKDQKLVDPRGEVEDGERFLLDFIKNRTWIDKNDLTAITMDDDGDNNHHSKNKKGHDSGHDDDDDSLEQLEKTDDFEAKYNFRFEEAMQTAAAATTTSGADYSVRPYARSQTMNTLRRKDDSRREKRLARKERKAAERKAKEEKLRRLKNAKREEMEEKLKQVKAVLVSGAAAAAKKKKISSSTGADDETGGADDNDKDNALKDAPIDEAAILKLLEGDYDPEKFEKSMQEAFGENFYEKEDAVWRTDEDVKATLQQDGDVEYIDLEDDDDNSDNDAADYQGDDDGYGGNEEYDDEEYEYNRENEEEETELEKKVRTKMMDKLYELDYEDIVGGMPTRFKYREVEPNDYGLTTEEILLARDQTLKQFVSLKKMAPYREGEEYRVSSRKRRKFREMLKQDIEETEQRLKEQGITVQDNHKQQEAGDDENDAKKKKKRRRMKKSGDKGNGSDQLAELAEASSASGEPKHDRVEEGDNAGEVKKTKRRRKKKGKKSASTPTTFRDAGDGASTKPEEGGEKSKIVPSQAKPARAEASGEMEASTTPGILLKDSKKSKKKKKQKEKKKAKKAKVSVDGVSAARLASYGL